MKCAPSLAFAAPHFFVFGVRIESALDFVSQTIDCLADCTRRTSIVVRTYLVSDGATAAAKSRSESNHVGVHRSDQLATNGTRFRRAPIHRSEANTVLRSISVRGSICYVNFDCTPE